MLTLCPSSRVHSDGHELLTLTLRFPGSCCIQLLAVIFPPSPPPPQALEAARVPQLPHLYKLMPNEVGSIDIVKWPWVGWQSQASLQ